MKQKEAIMDMDRKRLDERIEKFKELFEKMIKEKNLH